MNMGMKQGVARCGLALSFATIAFGLTACAQNLAPPRHGGTKFTGAGGAFEHQVCAPKVVCETVVRIKKVPVSAHDDCGIEAADVIVAGPNVTSIHWTLSPRVDTSGLDFRFKDGSVASITSGGVVINDTTVARLDEGKPLVPDTQETFSNVRQLDKSSTIDVYKPTSPYVKVFKYSIFVEFQLGSAGWLPCHDIDPIIINHD